MDKYDLIFILDSEDKTKLTKISSIITQLGAKIVKSNSLGKKQFSYKIKGKLSGYYFDWQISIQKNKLKELTQQLDLENLMIRYLIIKI